MSKKSPKVEEMDIKNKDIAGENQPVMDIPNPQASPGSAIGDGEIDGSIFPQVSEAKEELIDDVKVEEEQPEETQEKGYQEYEPTHEEILNALGDLLNQAGPRKLELIQKIEYVIKEHKSRM